MALAYPTRQGLPEYLAYQDEVESTVARINERWGTPGWTPIVLEVEDDYPRSLAALTRYDVLLVNPVRDGLNLVAMEGPLINRRDGVLALSREAGAFDQSGRRRPRGQPVRRDRHGHRAGPGAGPRTRRSGRPGRPPCGTRSSARRPADWLADQLAAARPATRRRAPPPTCPATGGLSGPRFQPGQHGERAPSGPSTARSAAAATSGAVSASRTATPTVASPSSGASRARSAKAGRSPRSSPKKQAARHPSVRPSHHGSLVDRRGRAQFDRDAARDGRPARCGPPPRPPGSATRPRRRAPGASGR